jgi:putative flavoprotein involved in K+ transport
LKQQGRDFVILDASQRVDDVWRNRWDSLRLFTPARYDGLPGLPFPAPANTFPTKDAMANYLEAYATQFTLPVHLATRVDHLSSQNGHFIITAGQTRYEAQQVVVAIANLQQPRVPAFAEALAPRIKQLHSSAYRGLEQLQAGDVLVAGGGNSGAEIGYEVARGHPTGYRGETPVTYRSALRGPPPG